MAEKIQKAKTKRKMKYMTFSAYPDEIVRWKTVAKDLDRSLSWWIRNELNKAVPARVVEVIPEVKQEAAS